MPLPDAYQTLLRQAVSGIQAWESQWPAYTPDETLAIDDARLQGALGELVERLGGNYPFFHPLYAGQMLKPPHPVAMLGYWTAMLINPNNHALDGGPPTSVMEKECVALLGKAFGYATPLGHLTSGGTMANLEALWIGKKLQPGKVILYSDEAHYTHGRMGDLMGAPHRKVASNPQGQLDLNALTHELEKGDIGTVVATLGTTALGAMDDLPAIVALKERYGFRLHVDMAYGGFYHVLRHTDLALAAFDAVQHADSLVIDPHKHGLQPYGCGCVLFRDPAVGQLYQHDSPYTYFTNPDQLHLGEISLECSRSGASAAALWLTLQCFPLEAEEGFGPILKKTRQAALSFAEALTASPDFQVYLPPALDIVTYFPQARSTREISKTSEHLFERAMASREQPLFLAKFTVSTDKFHRNHPEITVDSESVTLLRSCLMRPEQLDWGPTLVESLHAHLRQTVSS